MNTHIYIAVLADIESGKINGKDVIGSALAIARTTEEQMGGTSGALYSFVPFSINQRHLHLLNSIVRIFFSSLAQGLVSEASVKSEPQPTDLTHTVWTSALQHALARLYTYTRARPPSRTLVDPLAAFVQKLASSDFPTAVAAAAEAAEATRNLEAKAGRSAYVEGDILKREKIPDPGAWGVKVILEALLS